VVPHRPPGDAARTRQVCRDDPAQRLVALGAQQCRKVWRLRNDALATLRQLGGIHGFEVDVVDPVDFSGQPVSSSRIRRAVAGGDLASAAAMLGRPYGVVGQVGQGERRGRLLGVPTINLSEISHRKLLPPDGVYAVRVEWRGGGE